MNAPTVSLPTTAAVGAVNAMMALLATFNVVFTSGQQAAIISVVNAGLVAGAAFLDPKVPIGKQEPK